VNVCSLLLAAVSVPLARTKHTNHSRHYIRYPSFCWGFHLQWPRSLEVKTSAEWRDPKTGVLVTTRWFGSVTVRMLDMRSRGRRFDSQSARYQVVSTWMGDCLRTGKPSRYITNTKVNSAFHPSGVGKSSTGAASIGWG